MYKRQGYFTGDDPVELAEQALPKVKASGAHFKSVSYDDLPEIITRLQASSVSLATRLALEFLILTASRTTEVLEAHWSEIDLDKKLWVIPAERICSLSSVTNVTKCNGILSIKTTLVTLVTPFPKNFFQKLFRVENTIGANTLEHVLLYGMGSDGWEITPSTSMSSGPRPSNAIAHSPQSHRIKTA